MVKENVKLSACLVYGTSRHEDVCGIADVAEPLLTWALDIDEWSVSRLNAVNRLPLAIRTECIFCEV
jgi:hypothetical protein